MGGMVWVGMGESRGGGIKPVYQGFLLSFLPSKKLKTFLCARSFN